jgi:hypothetical protein
MQLYMGPPVGRNQTYGHMIPVFGVTTLLTGRWNAPQRLYTKQRQIWLYISHKIICTANFKKLI